MTNSLNKNISNSNKMREKICDKFTLKNFTPLWEKKYYLTGGSSHPPRSTDSFKFLGSTILSNK